MKVAHDMVDKELRFKGRLQSLLLNVSNDAAYLKRQQFTNKVMNKFLKGRNIKGLQCGGQSTRATVSLSPLITRCQRKHHIQQP